MRPRTAGYAMNFFIYILSCFFAAAAYGAGPQIKDVRFEQDKKGLVHIRYRLENAGPDILKVRVRLSQDGGKAFELQPKALSGAVGEVSGTGDKSVLWDIEKDSPDLKGPDFVFAVEAVDITARNREKAKLLAGQKEARIRAEREKARLLAEEEARRKEEEKARLLAEQEKARTPQGTVLIPKGAFQMGSPAGEGDADEHPRHKVWVDAFYIDKYEVTVAKYRKFARATGAALPGQAVPGAENDPVVQVSWNDADRYCKWAGRRLPTEAEWEKAARGGTAAKWSFGDAAAKAGDYAWYEDNSGKKAHPVGRKKPNQYGLYDMHGNVREWCSDWYAKDYYGSSPERNPAGPATGSARVVRGGSWLFNADNARSGFRLRLNPDNKNDNIGFRCAVPRQP